MKNVITAALTALTLSACADQAATVSRNATVVEPFIPSGGSAGGGSIRNYYNHVKELNRQGRSVEFRESVISASTFYLGVNTVCTEPETVFEFHGPSGPGATVFVVLVGLPSPDDFLSDEEHARIVGLMAEFYNDAFPGLGDWFLDSGAADKHGLATSRLRGSTLHAAFGVPLCDEV